MFKIFRYNYHFASVRGEKYCDEHVCVCFNLSACISQQLHVQISHVGAVFHPLTAMRYALYYRFCGRGHISILWREHARIKDDAYVSFIRQVASPEAISAACFAFAIFAVS